MSGCGWQFNRFYQQLRGKLYLCVQNLFMLHYKSLLIIIISNTWQYFFDTCTFCSLTPGWMLTLVLAPRLRIRPSARWSRFSPAAPSSPPDQQRKDTEDRVSKLPFQIHKKLKWLLRISAGKLNGSEFTLEAIGAGGSPLRQYGQNHPAPEQKFPHHAVSATVSSCSAWAGPQRELF